MTVSNSKRTNIRSIASDLTDQELALCVADVLKWRDRGILAEGPLHVLAARLVAETHIDEMSSMQLAEDAVMRETANRFIAAHSDK